MVKRRPIALLLVTAILLAATPQTSATAEGGPPTCQSNEVFTVTATAGPNGSISPDGPVEVCPGDDIVFTMTPAPGYVIDLLTVDEVSQPGPFETGQFTLANVQQAQAVHVTFMASGGEEGSEGGCQPNEVFTVTATAGPNGSISPSGEIEKKCGEDLVFTITPDEGYMVDDLSADGRPEPVAENGTFTLANIQRSQTVEVSFIEIVEFSVTIFDPVGGTITVAGEKDPIPPGGSVEVTRVRASNLGLLIALDGVDRTLTEVLIREEGVPESEFDEAGALFYDDKADSMRLDWSFEFNAEIRFTVKQDYLGAGVYEPVVILDNEDDNTIAVRRELAMRGIDVPANQLTVSSFTEKTSENGIGFGEGSAKIGGVDELAVYRAASSATFFLILDKEFGVVIAREDDPDTGESQVELPNFQTSKLTAIGPWGGRLFGLMSAGASHLFDEVLAPSGKAFRFTQQINAPFGLARFHAGGWGFNWMPLTLVQAGALVVEVSPTGAGGETEEALAWSYDRTPDLTIGDVEHQIFFGNDSVVIGAPSGGVGGVAGVAAAADRDRAGYTVTNNDGDGTLTVRFLSDFYDVLDVDLVITSKAGQDITRTLTIRRTGVELQTHDINVGPPGQTERWTWHGTQYGNQLALTGSAKYQVTASYHIPGFGAQRPYGLFVTRSYANGRVETALVTQAMNAPSPASADIFDPVERIFRYNDGKRGWANAVDYLVYSGPSRTAAPTSISVLVLRDAPTTAGAFGGLYFGSGAGVPWTKSDQG